MSSDSSIESPDTVQPPVSPSRDIDGPAKIVFPPHVSTTVSIGQLLTVRNATEIDPDHRELWKHLGKKTKLKGHMVLVCTSRERNGLVELGVSTLTSRRFKGLPAKFLVPIFPFVGDFDPSDCHQIQYRLENEDPTWTPESKRPYIRRTALDCYLRRDNVQFLAEALTKPLEGWDGGALRLSTAALADYLQFVDAENIIEGSQKDTLWKIVQEPEDLDGPTSAGGSYKQRLRERRNVYNNGQTWGRGGPPRGRYNPPPPPPVQQAWGRGGPPRGRYNNPPPPSIGRGRGIRERDAPAYQAIPEWRVLARPASPRIQAAAGAGLDEDSRMLTNSNRGGSGRVGGHQEGYFPAQPLGDLYHFYNNQPFNPLVQTPAGVSLGEDPQEYYDPQYNLGGYFPAQPLGDPYHYQNNQPPNPLMQTPADIGLGEDFQGYYNWQYNRGGWSHGGGYQGGYFPGQPPEDPYYNNRPPYGR